MDSDKRKSSKKESLRIDGCNLDWRYSPRLMRKNPGDFFCYLMGMIVLVVTGL